VVNVTGGDLVVGKFDAEASQFITAQTIYYDPTLNPDLGGQTFGLAGGGSLTVIPEPATWLLVLAGLGLLTVRRLRFR
jgi:hypothetical protein